MQQERKFDPIQLIGFALIAALLGIFFYINRPDPKEVERQKKEQAEKQKIENQTKNQTENNAISDFKPIGNTSDITIENDKFTVVFASKGGQIKSLLLKNYKAFNDKSGKADLPLYLIKDNNSKFDVTFKNLKNQLVHSALLQFSSEIQKSGDNSIVTLTSQSGNGIIKFIYTISKDYTIDFNIQSQGLNQMTNDKSISVNWDMNALSMEKGKEQESYWSHTYYRLKDGGKVEYELFGSDKWDEKDAVDWVAFKQQFFSSVLSYGEGFKNSEAKSDNPEKGSKFSKIYHFKGDVALNGSELNQKLEWSFVPLDYQLLKGYHDKDFDEIIPFGWSILGWLNRHFFLFIFDLLAKTGMQYGWVILLMTVVVKLVLSPIMLKQYKQSAMMRILRPEINEINEKYPDSKDAMKKQQATMALYNAAGANPLAGCLPALIQLPIFYALFRFFPNVINLRGVPFLWAQDLTAFDDYIHLPSWVPFLNEHLSIFALLYIVAMLVYFKISGSMDNFQMPQQEGMPNSNIMKYMMYVMPLFFFVFLNNYASGLSLYYLASNVINIFIVLFIKNVLINDEKLHAKMQANKTKPQKKSSFSQKMQTMMQKAQEAQEEQKRKNK